MRAEREGHPRPHAVQTEGSPGASAKHRAQPTAGESGEDRPAYRIDPGAPSRDVELGVRAPRGTSCGPGRDNFREAKAGRKTAPGGALACPARDRGVGAATGGGVLTAYQRSWNRRRTGGGGLCNAGARGERVSHVEAWSGIAAALPSAGGARRGPCIILLDCLRDVLGAGADPSSTGRIAEWAPRVGGAARHPNGNHLSAKSGWDETGTGESQHSTIRRSVGPAFVECGAAPTACSLGPSGSDPSGGADPIRSSRRL